MFIIFLILVTLISPILAETSDTLSAVSQKPYHRIYLPPPGESQVLRQWLIQKADANDCQAQHELCLRYLQGLGFPPDTGQAIFWLKKAVKAKFPAALYNQGIFLNNGIGMEWNPFDAYRSFQAATQTGMAEAYYAVGIIHTDNLIIKRDFKLAASYLKQAASQGFAPANDVLAELERRGLITPDTLKMNSCPDSASPNPDDWSTSSVLIDPNLSPDLINFNSDSLSDSQRDSLVVEILNKKSPELKSMLGITDSVSHGHSSDLSGIGLITTAASNSNPEALLILGRIYQKGIQTPKDPIKAMSCYLRAYRLGSPKATEVLYSILENQTLYDSLQSRIRRNNAEAMFVRAELSALGFDYRLTQEQAMDLLLKAVEKKHVAATIEAGLCYYTGTLVKKDKKKAYEYWSKSAALGEQEGLIRIAFTTILEDTLSASHHDQIIVLQNAAEKGSVLAQASLAYCYRNGLGVKQNKGRAANLYWSAAQRGNDAAYQSLKGMYNEIRPYDEEFQMPE